MSVQYVVKHEGWGFLAPMTGDRVVITQVLADAAMFPTVNDALDFVIRLVSRDQLRRGAGRIAVHRVVSELRLEKVA